MKTVTVKFDIEDPADRTTVKRFLSADELTFAVSNFVDHLRKHLKYDHGHSDEFLKGLEFARDAIYNELNEYGLTIDTLLE